MKRLLHSYMHLFQSCWLGLYRRLLTDELQQVLKQPHALSGTPAIMIMACTIPWDSSCIGLTWMTASSFGSLSSCTLVYTILLQNIWPNYIFLSFEDHLFILNGLPVAVSSLFCLLICLLLEDVPFVCVAQQQSFCITEIPWYHGTMRYHEIPCILLTPSDMYYYVTVVIM